MRYRRGPQGTVGRAAIGLVSLALLMAPAAGASASGLALVLGETSYSSLPALPGCSISAHAVAAALRGLGFTVDAQDDASSGALYAALGGLTRALTAAPQTPAVIYFCGYATGFDDRPFVLPVSASLSRPADVLSQGVLVKTLLNAITDGKPAAAVLVIDAVPMPKGPSALPLDALVQTGLPDTLGYIAASTSAPASTPTPLAAALVSVLRGPTVESAKLLTDTRAQLAGLNTASVAAFHAPEPGTFLAGTAAPPAAVAPPAPAPSAPRALPSEDQMTEAQRRIIQNALAHLGYYDAATDGAFGPETRAAIRRWQHEVHAPMTGHLNAEEASKLASSWD